jgi:hypothetical protein
MIINQDGLIPLGPHSSLGGRGGLNPPAVNISADFLTQSHVES